jgi:hypothetical protein
VQNFHKTFFISPKCLVAKIHPRIFSPFFCPVNNINMSAKKIVWNLCRPNAGPLTLVNVEHLGRKQKMGNLQQP